MSKQQTEPVNTTSADINEERLAQLRQLIPEAFTEGKIDFEKLRSALGDFVEDGPERYTFTWAGKRDAIKLLQTPTSATLVPARDESINFDDTSHIFIEGENLEVLKLIYKAYFGRIKLIYIDPPYNTGKDFIYPDNYTDPIEPYLRLTGQKDVEGNLITSNLESSGRFHSNWLNMMYPRLFIARQLLRDDGVIFVSIDDHESHNLRMIMNEIFGEEQFIANISVVNNLKGRSDKQNIATAHEHLLMYAKTSFESYGLPLDHDKLAEYDQIDEYGKRFQWRDLRKRGGADTRDERPNLFFPLYLNQDTDTLSLRRQNEGDVEIYPLKSDHSEGCWRWGKKRVADHIETLKASYVESSQRWNVHYRVYLEVNGEKRTSKPKSAWIGSKFSTDLAQRAFKKILPDSKVDFTPKAVGFLKEVIHQSAKDDDICLDFFAGSCTLAQALLELNREETSNRKFIAIQLPEPIDNERFPTIAEVGKERTRRVISGLKKTKQTELPIFPDEDLGFRVFKLTPSHFKPWSGSPNADPDTYNQQLDLFRDPLIEGWQPEPVIWEVAIKEGYPLHSRITAIDLAGHTVFCVTNPDNDQQFHICLESKITTKIPRQLGLATDDLFICRDLALDDSTAANLALQCHLKTI